MTNAEIAALIFFMSEFIFNIATNEAGNQLLSFKLYPMAIANPSSLKRAGKWKNQILVLYYGLTDPRTPFYSKLPALAALFYLLSTIDLIHDFVPLAVYLDDLIIVPPSSNSHQSYCQKKFTRQAKSKQSNKAGKITLALVVLGIASVFILLRFSLQ